MQGGRLTVRRVGVLRPLAHRDFALLWAGLTTSLLGDGIYLVAVAWQVYDLSNAPAALTITGVAWSLPQTCVLLLSGVLSDRHDRRRVMLAADGFRAVAIGVLGALAVAGTLRLWHVVALVAVYGVGEGLFYPAFQAIVPDLVPRDDLLQANALDSLVRPLAMRFAGPAVGGAVVAAAGPGTGFLIDAGTFVASAGAILAMRARPAASAPRAGSTGRAELAEGWRFVRAHAWIWGTLAAAAIALLAFLGPVQVLLPYIVKNRLHGGADDLGVVFAAGGAGSILAALVMGQRQLPRRAVRFMFAAWTISSGVIAGYAVVTAAWQAMVIAAAGRAVRHRRAGGVDDAHAPARPHRAARPRLELRLARLDRPRPGVLRTHGADRRRRGRDRHAGGRRRAGRRRNARLLPRDPGTAKPRPRG